VKMSVISQAKRELAAAGFPEDDARVIVEILEKFFSQFDSDSGGAVYGTLPVLVRCIKGLPLSELTGADDEWMEVGTDMYQNIRCLSVFKNTSKTPPHVFDVDAEDSRAQIKFPYWPAEV